MIPFSVAGYVILLSLIESPIAVDKKQMQHSQIHVTKGSLSREVARGHATNVDGIVLSVTINRIYNYNVSGWSRSPDDMLRARENTLY